MLNCRNCHWCRRSPFEDTFDTCEAPDRDSTFAKIERFSGNCGEQGLLYKERKSMFPKIQKYDYFYKYRSFFFYMLGIIVVSLIIIGFI